MKKDSFFHVAEYIRLSRDDGDKAESDSIVNQKKLLADYIKERENLFVYDIYIDDGFSGTNYERPAFRRMISDIEAGKVNCVIVKDLSRFGRDYIDTGRYLERYFPEWNVRFISITDNIDSFSQAYDMLLPIKNIFNEQYARDISRKIHASVLTKQKAGEFIGAFPSYGYKKSPSNKNKLVIDEYAAGVVRRIFALYNAGFGKLRIAGILNEEGVLCPSAYKNANGEQYRNAGHTNHVSYWSYSTVHRILQNEMYLGNMVQGRKSQQMRGKAHAKQPEDWIVVPGTHDAVIDRDTWKKTQDLLNRRTRSLDLTSNPSVLAGFLKCGDCGRALVKKNNSSGTCYYCGSYVRSGRHACTPHKISYQTLQHILLKDLNAILHHMNISEKNIMTRKFEPPATTPEQTQEKKRMLMELNRIQRLKKSVYEDYRDELLSEEEFTAYRQDYALKEELLKKQLISLESSKDTQELPDILSIPWIQHLLKYHEVEHLDREIVTAMLHEIRIYEDHRITVVYRFSDEPERFTDNLNC
ncbi:MAG: recombinase family protein [Lachnospiraceae bacterium]|nr:recombinase family protein [Lachnospiraceae bacterium]